MKNPVIEIKYEKSNFLAHLGCNRAGHIITNVTFTMQNRIEFNFDKRINGYVVTMPDFVTLDMIEEWKDRFDQELKTIRSSNKFELIFDTNKHNFESIQCLKILREYLTDNKVLKSRFSRTALVAPAKFMAPNIKSEVEAYFNNLEQAYKWLEE